MENTSVFAVNNIRHYNAIIAEYFHHEIQEKYYICRQTIFFLVHQTNTINIIERIIIIIQFYNIKIIFKLF